MTKQRSFASLTEEEINQVAEWLQHGTYDESPRPHRQTAPGRIRAEPQIQTPLETLWQNKNTVDKINRKLASHLIDRFGLPYRDPQASMVNSGAHFKSKITLHDAIKYRLPCEFMDPSCSPTTSSPPCESEQATESNSALLYAARLVSNRKSQIKNRKSSSLS